MQRRYNVYLNDILDAIQRIEEYVRGIDFKEFIKNTLIQDGVIRNLEIIGKAVKNIPEEIREKYPK